MHNVNKQLQSLNVLVQQAVPTPLVVPNSVFNRSIHYNQIWFEIDTSVLNIDTRSSVTFTAISSYGKKVLYFYFTRYPAGFISFLYRQVSCTLSCLLFVWGGGCTVTVSRLVGGLTLGAGACLSLLYAVNVLALAAYGPMIWFLFVGFLYKN